VPHYAAAYYGILKLGATVVNFSPLYTVDELAHQVEDSGTKLLFTLSASALLPTALKVLDGSGLERLVVGSVAGALPATKSLLYRLFRGKEVTKRPDDARITAFSALIANDGKRDFPAIDPATHLALIQYTGGTTGTPKGAMLTHQNLSANARQVEGMDPHPGEEDRIIGVLPLFHVFANTCVMNRTVANGGMIVLLPRFDGAQVLAAIELGRRTLVRTPADRVRVTSPRQVASYLLPLYGSAAVEQFGIVMLDTKHRIIRAKVLSVGSLDAAVVHPREVFREATTAAAAAVVLFHNHPSGDPTPSQDDLRLTVRMKSAGEIMGIAIVDHVILADQRYFSLVEAGQLSRVEPRGSATPVE